MAHEAKRCFFAWENRLLLPFPPRPSRPRHVLSSIPRRFQSDSTTAPEVVPRASRSHANPPSQAPLGRRPPLSILPLSSLLRSYIITLFSSTPYLLHPSLAVLSHLTDSKSNVLSPDHNVLLRWLLKRTLYAQFCAGENRSEVQTTIDRLKGLGYRGVILGHAREAILDIEAITTLADQGKVTKATSQALNDIKVWKTGCLETVRLTSQNDFVALKFSGAGSQALSDLSRDASPTRVLEEAITEICDLAAERGVSLLFDAEQQAIQAGIDSWALEFMRRYNKKGPSDRAVVYNTYQAYLKAMPSILARHLSIAQKEGFTIGVKLVRGAYLGSDPRHVINDTKAQTDDAYDKAAEGLLRRSYNHVLQTDTGESNADFPAISLVLASHNRHTIRKAQEICALQAQDGNAGKVDLVHAQLMGMADEISCELVQASRGADGKEGVDVPKAYKYLVWGTTGQCMKYLVRRAEENRDAVARTKEGRLALGRELSRRIRQAMRLSQ
ncbi:MAG: proline dehydrogenase [Sclerophora amabilis]|nr:MAG: proline dehydrogenase [Sclerophora amabilis]